MSATNYGNQNITFGFKFPLDSYRTDRALNNVFSPGVYEGMTITKEDDTHVDIAAGKVIISDGTYAAIIETVDTVENLIISNGTPYIVMRWTYIASATNKYADFTTVSQANLQATDIILGKAIFSGTTLTSIDISSKIIPNKLVFEEIEDRLKVVENPTAVVAEVIVHPGFIILTNGNKYEWVTNQTITLAVADVTNPRIDLIVVNEDGNLVAISGTPLASPVAPSYEGNFGLAEVYVAANATKIYTEDITDVRSFFTAPFSVASILELTDARYYAREIIDSREDLLKVRIEASENKNLEQEIRLGYLEQRQQLGSNQLLDMFLDENLTGDYINSSNKESEIMDDTDFNDNWKNRDGQPDYKNGFMKPQKQKYMLEPMDYYDLEGVGQIYKSGISRYDTANDCYWFITQKGSDDIGELIKLSPKMEDGKVIVLSRWYLVSPGTNLSWAGIDVDIDNQVLFIIIHWDGVSGGILALEINSDGTLGLKNKSNGQTLEKPALGWSRIRTDAVGTYDWSAWEDGHTDYYYNDVTVWDDNSVAVIACDNAAGIPTKLAMVGRTYSSGKFSTTSVSNDITDLILYITGSNVNDRGLIREGNDLWININDAADNFRYIFKIDIVNDIVSDKLIKVSGRFQPVHDIDNDTNVAGITISDDGHILDIVSTASNGHYIAKRALKNTLWAENQVAGELVTTEDAPTSDDNRALCDDGDYIWYSANNSNADAVRIYRKNKSTGAETYMTLNAGSWDYVFAMCIGDVSGTDYFYLLGNAATQVSRAISRTTFEAALNGTLNMGTAGTAFTGYEAKTQLGICTDGTYLYIMCDGDDAIDKWNMLATPTKHTDNYITLPAPVTYWRSLTYKNGKFYCCNFNTGGQGKIYCIDDEGIGAGSDNWFVLQVYQDSENVAGIQSGIIIGNDLWVLNSVTLKIQVVKILEDPNVLQVQSFISLHNVLPSIQAYCATPVVERFFEPEEFSDIRNCPDKYYSGVGYFAAGFSLLHLDEYISEKSSTGKNRYDPKKIRIQNYERSTSEITADFNIIADVSTKIRIISSIAIERDMIFLANYGNDITLTYMTLQMIDLKSGKAHIFQTGDWTIGQEYLGSLNERNDGKGYGGTHNPEMTLSGDRNISGHRINKLFARTFTKEDSSDYNLENPKTFVLIGMDAGCDLLVIDWDENNNRTPVKIWNNIFNSTTIGTYGLWIAPSGQVFGGFYSNPGNIYWLPNKMSVWEVAADGIGADRGTATIIKSNILDFAPNSRCWKMSNGEWRHQLLVGTYDTSTTDEYDYGVLLYDVENDNVKWVQRVDTDLLDTDDAYTQVDMFEDNCFGQLSLNVSATEAAHRLREFKKLRFDRKMDTDLQNDWMWKNHSSAERPIFLGYPLNTTGKSRICKYSKLFNFLITGSTISGLQLIYFPEMDNCKHESIDIELSNNPRHAHYLQNVILPTGEKVNILANDDADITYVNGASANWSVVSGNKQLDADGVTEGYLKWENITGYTRIGISFIRSTDCGKCKVSVFNITDKLDKTGDTHTTITVDDIASTADLEVGMLVIGTDIPANTRIATIIDANSITITKTATGTTDNLDLDFYPVEIAEDLLDLYMSAKEDIVYWITLLAAKEYVVYVEHNGDKNASSSDELLKIYQYLLVEQLVTASIDVDLKIWHSDHSGEDKEYELVPSTSLDLEYQQAFNGDNAETNFTLSGENRAYEPIEFSADGGTTWMYPSDLALSWGTNNPDFDNETIDANGFFTVKFDTPPVIGTGNVIIKYVPKADKYKVITTIKHPYKGSYVDNRRNVRLLDHATELLG